VKILAIIPARGGSKGIPQKNIRLLNGKPLIEYPIDCAKNSKLINRIIVSTDSIKIAKIARDAGAEVPFLRPKEISNDTASQLDVLKHTLDFLEKEESYTPDIITWLHATNPFTTPQTVVKSIKMLKNSKSDLVLGVFRMHAHPYRSFLLENNRLKRFSKDFDKYYQRQLYPSLYFPTGDIYTFWYKSFKKYGKIFAPNITPLIYEKDEISINIDTPFDFFVAEMVLKHWNKFKRKFSTGPIVYRR
jgi:CMP-N,N'-diacetyllegionaminic acid synthase